MTAKRKALVVTAREVPADTAFLIPAQGRALMEAMNGDIDEWAIKERKGPGGKKLKYIPHGYTRHMLGKTFGPFWSFRTIEILPGKRYDVVEYMGKVKNERTGMDEERVMQEIIVMVELRYRIFDSHGQMISEEYMTGTGGKVREPSIPFTSDIQSAESDALKRAAFSLGRKFGLELYYDDEELRAEWQERFAPRAPAKVAELYKRVQSDGISPELWEQVTGTSLDTVEERQIASAWEKWEAYQATPVVEKVV